MACNKSQSICESSPSSKDAHWCSKAPTIRQTFFFLALAGVGVALLEKAERLALALRPVQAKSRKPTLGGRRHDAIPPTQRELFLGPSHSSQVALTGTGAHAAALPNFHAFPPTSWISC